MSTLYVKEAEMHLDSAREHEAAGDDAVARHQYCAAMGRAKRGGVSRAVLWNLTYDCGRTSAYICDFPNAEKYLLTSLALGEEVSGPDSGKVSAPTFELARLYAFQGNFTESAKYFEKGLPMLEKLGTPEHDPLSYADALEAYGDMLASAGQAAQSTTEKAKAVAVRENHPGAKIHFVQVQYKCPQQQ